MKDSRIFAPFLVRAALGLVLCIVVAPAAAAQQADEPAADARPGRRGRAPRQPADRSGRRRRKNAVSGERVAKAAFLPSLSISSGTSRSSTERLDPVTNSIVSSGVSSYSAGLSSSIDLFTGGRRGAEIDRARSQHLAAKASLVERRFAVVLARQAAPTTTCYRADAGPRRRRARAARRRRPRGRRAWPRSGAGRSPTCFELSSN